MSRSEAPRWRCDLATLVIPGDLGEGHPRLGLERRHQRQCPSSKIPARRLAHEIRSAHDSAALPAPPARVAEADQLWPDLRQVEPPRVASLKLGARN